MHRKHLAIDDPDPNQYFDFTVRDVSPHVVVEAIKRMCEGQKFSLSNEKNGVSINTGCARIVISQTEDESTFEVRTYPHVPSAWYTLPLITAVVLGLGSLALFGASLLTVLIVVGALVIALLPGVVASSKAPTQIRTFKLELEHILRIEYGADVNLTNRAIPIRLQRRPLADDMADGN